MNISLEHLHGRECRGILQGVMGQDCSSQQLRSTGRSVAQSLAQRQVAEGLMPV